MHRFDKSPPQLSSLTHQRIVTRTHCHILHDGKRYNYTIAASKNKAGYERQESDQQKISSTKQDSTHVTENKQMSNLGTETWQPSQGTCRAFDESTKNTIWMKIPQDFRRVFDTQFSNYSQALSFLEEYAQAVGLIGTRLTLEVVQAAADATARALMAPASASSVRTVSSSATLVPCRSLQILQVLQQQNEEFLAGYRVGQRKEPEIEWILDEHAAARLDTQFRVQELVALERYAMKMNGDQDYSDDEFEQAIAGGYYLLGNWTAHEEERVAMLKKQLEMDMMCTTIALIHAGIRAQWPSKGYNGHKVPLLMAVAPGRGQPMELDVPGKVLGVGEALSVFYGFEQYLLREALIYACLFEDRAVLTCRRLDFFSAGLSSARFRPPDVAPGGVEFSVATMSAQHQFKLVDLTEMDPRPLEDIVLMPGRCFVFEGKSAGRLAACNIFEPHKLEEMYPIEFDSTGELLAIFMQGLCGDYGCGIPGCCCARCGRGRGHSRGGLGRSVSGLFENVLGDMDMMDIRECALDIAERKAMQLSRRGEVNLVGQQISGKLGDNVREEVAYYAFVRANMVLKSRGSRTRLVTPIFDTYELQFAPLQLKDAVVHLKHLERYALGRQRDTVMRGLYGLRCALQELHWLGLPEGEYHSAAKGLGAGRRRAGPTPRELDRVLPALCNEKLLADNHRRAQLHGLEKRYVEFVNSYQELQMEWREYVLRLARFWVTELADNMVDYILGVGLEITRSEQALTPEHIVRIFQ